MLSCVFQIRKDTSIERSVLTFNKTKQCQEGSDNSGISRCPFCEGILTFPQVAVFSSCKIRDKFCNRSILFNILGDGIMHHYLMK